MAAFSPAAIVRRLPQPAVLVDAGLTVTVNEQFRQLTGVPADNFEDTSEPLQGCFPPGCESLVNTISAILDGDGDQQHTVEITISADAATVDEGMTAGNAAADGDTATGSGPRYARGTAEPVTETGEIVGALVVFTESGYGDGSSDGKGGSSDGRVGYGDDRTLSGGQNDQPRTNEDRGLAQNRSEEGQKHDQFYHAFERHRAPMLLIDPESGRIEDANDAAVSFYGYGEDLVSMRIQDINTLSAEEVALERERARRESRNHFNFEHRLACGEVRPVEVHSSPIQFGDRELLFSIIHDVSERERHKNALQRERAFSDSALNVLTDIFYVTDESGRMRRWNDRLSEVTGYDDEAIEGMAAAEFFADSDGSRIEAAIDEIRENGGQITQELTIETKSGVKIPYEFTGSLLTVAGEAIGVAGIGRDISNRKEREQSLRQLRRAIEATPHGVFLTDSRGQIGYVNPAFEAMTGYSESDVLGKTPAILKSGVHDDAFYRELWETITAGELWQAQITNERKSGERYHAHQTIAPITGEDGTITAYVAIQTDITSRKERQQHLRVLSRVLRHNLQNDLSVIRSYAEQIDSEQSGPVDKIVRKTDEIVELARKERKIATILADEITQRELDVTRLVERAITDIDQEYPDASIHVNLGEEVSAVGTPQLKTAVSELIENAIAHNDDDVEISVRVQVTDDAVEITIADDGTGIPESEREILETGADIDPLYHGTGLGLWLVYWIVRRSGGALQFAENDPQGSVVTITLGRERVVDTRGYAFEY